MEVHLKYKITNSGIIIIYYIQSQFKLNTRKTIEYAKLIFFSKITKMQQILSRVTFNNIIYNSVCSIVHIHDKNYNSVIHRNILKIFDDLIFNFN